MTPTNGSEKGKWPKRTLVSVAAGLAFLICLTFFPTLRNGWIEDDHYVIEKNPYITSIRHLPHIFSVQTWEATSWSDRKSGIYRPVPLASYFIDHHLFQTAPWGSHFLNLFLHTLNVLLFFLLIINFLSPARSFFAAAIYGVHPIVVEPVAWVSARFDLMAAFFGWLFLIAIYQLVIVKTSRFRLFLSLAVLSVFGGCLSKETFYLLTPLTLSGLVLYQRKKREPIGKTLAIGLTTMIAMITCLVLRSLILDANTESLLSPVILENSLAFGRRLFWVFINPSTADAFSRYDPELSPSLGAYLFLLASIGICLGLAYLAQRRVAVLFAMGIALAGWLPSILILDFHDYLPDRYFYFAFPGLLLLAASTIRTPKTLRAPLLAALVIWIGFLSFFSHTHAKAWKSPLTLYDRSARMNPQNYVPYEKMAFHYKYVNDWARLVITCDELIRLHENHPWCLNILGVHGIRTGQWEKANHYLHAAHKFDPKRTQTHYNLGLLFEKMEMNSKAIHWYRKTLELNNSHKLARASLNQLKKK